MENVTQHELRTHWSFVYEDKKYIRTLIEWMDDKPNSIGWRENFTPEENEECPSETQLETEFQKSVAPIIEKLYNQEKGTFDKNNQLLKTGILDIPVYSEEDIRTLDETSEKANLILGFTEDVAKYETKTQWVVNYEGYSYVRTLFEWTNTNKIMVEWHFNEIKKDKFPWLNDVLKCKLEKYFSELTYAEPVINWKSMKITEEAHTTLKKYCDEHFLRMNEWTSNRIILDIEELEMGKKSEPKCNS